MCPTLYDPVDCSLPGFSVREGALQARTLEYVGQYRCHALLEPKDIFVVVVVVPSLSCDSL